MRKILVPIFVFLCSIFVLSGCSFTPEPQDLIGAIPDDLTSMTATLKLDISGNIQNSGSNLDIVLNNEVKVEYEPSYSHLNAITNLITKNTNSVNISEEYNDLVHNYFMYYDSEKKLWYYYVQHEDIEFVQKFLELKSKLLEKEFEFEEQEEQYVITTRLDANDILPFFLSELSLTSPWLGEYQFDTSISFNKEDNSLNSIKCVFDKSSFNSPHDFNKFNFEFVVDGYNNYKGSIPESVLKDIRSATKKLKDTTYDEQNIISTVQAYSFGKYSIEDIRVFLGYENRTDKDDLSVHSEMSNYLHSLKQGNKEYRELTDEQIIDKLFEERFGKTAGSNEVSNEKVTTAKDLSSVGKNKLSNGVTLSLASYNYGFPLTLGNFMSNRIEIIDYSNFDTAAMNSVVTLQIETASGSEILVDIIVSDVDINNCAISKLIFEDGFIFESFNLNFVKLGDNYDNLVAQLGEPDNEFTSGQYMIYEYNSDSVKVSASFLNGKLYMLTIEIL